MNAILPADWPAPPGVHAFTTLRYGAGVSQPPFDHFNLGMRSGDEADAVARNRIELFACFGLPSSPRWLRQVHGTTVVTEPGDDEPEADAAVTSTPGTVLAILSADCMPVVFAANDGSEVAVAHAGWRGLSAGVLEATLAAMHTPPARVQVWLGPAAGPQAYEVGADVFDDFARQDAHTVAAFVATRPGHWHVDLYALARQRLAVIGIERVYGGALCTISDAHRFYSHRRDQCTGRMATLAWMQP